MIIKESAFKDVREEKTVHISTDFVVVGGGMSGVCAAITAARQGIRVVLVQDRPVLGGNASSEVRLWILGATSHMGNNNRWAREGGVIDEILVENLYRNSDGNPLILDTILLEKVKQEKNISLLLNTTVFDLKKNSPSVIEKIIAFCSQNSTRYEVEAPLFCDASGDGIVGFKAGAAFRMGAESKHEFGELFAPDEEYGDLLGHSLYFYSKRVSHPVKYIPPSFALDDIKEIPRYKIIDREDKGCRFWWLEYGGRRDTIHDTEEIKWELWKIVYGVWNYIKNSGEFEDVDNLTLEWVGTIPGKRESRRFEGLYMLKQQDLVEQRDFDDVIAFGGWALDLHPADGVYSKLPGCTQWHTKGVYQIPYRSLVSKDISNLFFAGRIISTTHVAHGSTRVMATSAFSAQAVGMAAALCIRTAENPDGLIRADLMATLQNKLNLNGQSIPGKPIDVQKNLLGSVSVSSSSSLKLAVIPADGTWLPLRSGAAQLLPLRGGEKYTFGLTVQAEEASVLVADLRISSKSTNYTPDLILETVTKELVAGEQYMEIEFQTTIPSDQYAFVTLCKNEKISIAQSDKRYTGVLAVFNGINKAVSNNGRQIPPEGIGIESFEFWIPYRRPEGKNLAMTIKPALDCFQIENVFNGFTRPGLTPNAWVSDPNDPSPQLTVKWDNPTTISGIKLFFDTDYDHPLESVLMGHPERIIPFCIRRYRVRDETGRLLFYKNDNYQTINDWIPGSSLVVRSLTFEFDHPGADIPASLFELHID